MMTLNLVLRRICKDLWKLSPLLSALTCVGLQLALGAVPVPCKSR